MTACCSRKIKFFVAEKVSASWSLFLFFWTKKVMESTLKRDLTPPLAPPLAPPTTTMPQKPKQRDERFHTAAALFNDGNLITISQAMRAAKFVAQQDENK